MITDRVGSISHKSQVLMDKNRCRQQWSNRGRGHTKIDPGKLGCKLRQIWGGDPKTDWMSR